MRRAIIDQESLLNVIPLSILEAVEVPIEISSFEYISTYTLGFVYLDLIVGPTRMANQFHVIESHTSYHLLLGNP